MYRKILIQTADFSCGKEIDNLRRQVSGGALCLFSGIVREFFQQNPIDGLILEHYPGMTEKSVEKIVQQAADRWALQGVTVIHRVGPLAPGDQIVLVCCLTEHRADAFLACQFIMDLLKTDAVFWKKEASKDSERWVESLVSDRTSAARWKNDGTT